MGAVAVAVAVRGRHVERRLSPLDRNAADARRTIVADTVALAAPFDSALDRVKRAIAALDATLDPALERFARVVAIDDALHYRCRPLTANTLLRRAPVANAVIAVAVRLHALDMAGLADLARPRGRRLAGLAHLNSAIGPDVRFGALRAFGTLRAFGALRALGALRAFRSFGALWAIRAFGLLRVTVGFVLRRRKRRRRNTCKKCGE
jgi:hypothetical protein